MNRIEFILYVKDQVQATTFYKAVLACEPTLNVPGMTEFELRDRVVLGLMPASGIRRLLGDSIQDPSLADQIPRAELYLSVDSAQEWVDRALAAGGKLLSPVTLKNWGDYAGYVADLDGHVLAFAQSPP